MTFAPVKEENKNTIKNIIVDHVAHAWSKVGLSDKKIGFDDSFGVHKCLQRIEIPDLLHTCAVQSCSLSIHIIFTFSISFFEVRETNDDWMKGCEHGTYTRW